ncbi:AraC family transcriptional regulator [uncultured Sphaerochaeta sp.]|uniref:helix-turn-helix domain-containing protein n=1 Tax=uncultured Sphaerochaeta sp. TaxID=886478 RepID=UPI002A0A7C03|nr:AraC family transcriptional regulator [uncultured Sphaerochaeta sp.]
MELDYKKASRRLSELNISCEINGLTIDVQWFRVMLKNREWSISRHAHSSYEFHIIAQGDCIVETDDGSFYATEGTVFLCGPGVYHSQKSGNCENLIEFSLDCKFRTHKDAESSHIDLVDLFKTTPCLPFQCDPHILDLFGSALKEALNQSAGYDIIIQSIVPCIIVALARTMGYLKQVPKSTELNRTRMDVIADFVDDNIFKSLSPADIAGFLNLSEKQISRVLMAAEGVSTKKFITVSKINKAKQLMVEENYSIVEISNMLGFSNTSHFTNVFKALENITPGVYKEKYKSKPIANHVSII